MLRVRACLSPALYVVFFNVLIRSLLPWTAPHHSSLTVNCPVPSSGEPLELFFFLNRMVEAAEAQHKFYFSLYSPQQQQQHQYQWCSAGLWRQRAEEIWRNSDETCFFTEPATWCLSKHQHVHRMYRAETSFLIQYASKLLLLRLHHTQSIICIYTTVSKKNYRKCFKRRRDTSVWSI